MRPDLSALERRLTALERKPSRLTWTICAVIALPLLLAALIEHQVGQPHSVNELIAVVLYLVAFGITVSLLDQLGLLRHRPLLAVLLALPLFVLIAFGIGLAGVNLGIVTP